MYVIKRGTVPLYELTCIECGSVLRYKASEVINCHITCPVCGTSLWAETNVPVGYENINTTVTCSLVMEKT